MFSPYLLSKWIITINMRRHNYRLIKGQHSYTFKEISKQLNVHNRTIRRWRKSGMKLLDEKSHPFLVLGKDLIRFLKQKDSDRRVKLLENEFFCMKCKLPRESKPEMIQLEFNGKTIGKNQKQVIIRGVCCECTSRLTRISTESKIEDIRKQSMLYKQCDIVLPDNIGSCLYADIEEIKR
jgi:hypothetical protein